MSSQRIILSLLVFKNYLYRARIIYKKIFQCFMEICFKKKKQNKNAYVINSFFSGCLELKEDTIENLLAAACLLQLPQVVEVCCHFLMKLLHPSNCLGIRAFADAQGCTELMKVAHNYTMVRQY